MLLDILEKEFLKPLEKNNGKRVEEIFKDFELFYNETSYVVWNPEIKTIYGLIHTAISESCFYGGSYTPTQFIDKLINEFTYSSKVNVFLEYVKAVKNKLKFYGDNFEKEVIDGLVKR